MSNDFEIPPFHSLVAPSSCMLHWGKHLHTMQRFTSQCRNMCMFLETRLPESLCAADIAKIALSASILINNTWHKGFSGNLSLNEKKDASLFPDLKTILKLQNGTFFFKVFIKSFLTFHDVEPRNGKTIIKSSFGTVWNIFFFSNNLFRKVATHWSTNFEG